MDQNDVRRGIAQSKANEGLFGVISFDALILSIYAWVHTGIFLWFLVALVSTLVSAILIAQFKATAMMASLLLGFAYGYVAYGIMEAISASLGNTIGVAIFVGAMACGAHIGGFQYANDLSKNGGKSW